MPSRPGRRQAAVIGSVPAAICVRNSVSCGSILQFYHVQPSDLNFAMRTPTRRENLAPWLQEQYEILSTLERLGEPNQDFDTGFAVAKTVNEAERVAVGFGIPVGDEQALTSPRDGLAIVGRLLAAAQTPAEVLTVPEASRLLRVKDDTIRGWIATGRLKAANVGDGPRRPRYRIARQDLDASWQAGPGRPKPSRSSGGGQAARWCPNTSRNGDYTRW